MWMDEKLVLLLFTYASSKAQDRPLTMRRLMKVEYKKVPTPPMHVEYEKEMSDGHL